MLSQHKEAGGFSISVDELKWRLELIEAEKQPGKYIHFNALKRRVLEVAQRELDKYADITFSYEAIKTGRKYTDLTFRIYPNKNIHMHGEKGAMSVQQEQNLSLGRKPFIHSGITLF